MVSNVGFLLRESAFTGHSFVQGVGQSGPTHR
jgi:hypothetical protein